MTTNNRKIAKLYDDLNEELSELDVSDRAVKVITALAALETLATIDLERFGHD